MFSQIIILFLAIQSLETAAPPLYYDDLQLRGLVMIIFPFRMPIVDGSKAEKGRTFFAEDQDVNFVLQITFQFYPTNMPPFLDPHEVGPPIFRSLEPRD